MTVQCIFDDVSERDMDMLIAEEMVSSAGFRKLFLDKIGISNADVLSVELSKTDPALGESDITVTLSADDKRIGLLIEDKVDAIAMPEQAARYTLRGERGVSDGLYDEFYLKQGFTVQRTGKAAAIRLSVPVLDFHLSFESQIEKIRECFTEIRRMNDLVKAFDPADVSALLTG